MANTSAKLLAVLALSLPLAIGGWAQDAPANAMAMKAQSPKPAKPHKAAKAAQHSRAAATAKPAAGAAEAQAAPASPEGDKIEAVGKRDPFAPLINDKKDSRPAFASGQSGLGNCHGARGWRRTFGQLNDRGGLQSGAERLFHPGR